MYLLLLDSKVTSDFPIRQGCGGEKVWYLILFIRIQELYQLLRLSKNIFHLKILEEIFHNEHHIGSAM